MYKVREVEFDDLPSPELSTSCSKCDPLLRISDPDPEEAGAKSEGQHLSKKKLVEV